MTGNDIDVKYDTPKCKNYTAKAANEFTTEYHVSIAYVGNEYEQVGVLVTVWFDEKLHVQIEVQGDAVKDIQRQYGKFQSVYDGQYSDELLPRFSFDHAINMVYGQEPPWGPIYALLEKELGVLREYLDTMLASSHMHSSKSPAGTPIMSQRKRAENYACV